MDSAVVHSLGAADVHNIFVALHALGELGVQSLPVPQVIVLRRWPDEVVHEMKVGAVGRKSCSSRLRDGNMLRFLMLMAWSLTMGRLVLVVLHGLVG